MAASKQSAKASRGEFGLVFSEREQRSMNLALALIPRPLSAASSTHTSGVPYQEAPARCKARGNPTWQYVGSISQLRVSVKAPTEAAADVQRSKAVKYKRVLIRIV